MRRIAFLGRSFVLIAVVLIPVVGVSTAANAPKAPSDPVKAPSVRYQLTGVELPQDLCRELGLENRLAGGGTVLSGEEARKLVEKFQSHARTNLTFAPTLLATAGQDVYLGVPWGKSEVTCEIVADVIKEEKRLAVQIVSDVVKQGSIKAGAGTTKPKRRRPSIHAELMEGESIVFGGWKAEPSAPQNGKETVLIIIAEPQLETP